MLSAASNIFRTFTRQFRPLGNRILVSLKKEEKVGAIYVPDTAQQEGNQGTVKAVGPGAMVNGKLVPTTLKVGDVVILPKFGGQTLKMDKEEYTIISEEDILAVLK